MWCGVGVVVVPLGRKWKKSERFSKYTKGFDSRRDPEESVTQKVRLAQLQTMHYATEPLDICSRGRRIALGSSNRNSPSLFG
ncbi:hypothetical protein CEXT_412121 [Caerostris extrusa]|uniref:Uncharacterized protein n=1 Tax=Caerostris extrusa TaxID=172846 RepID=A0AAV4NRI6_CAEEX|nr:hypothetical protein CEXT_412121 [Caerostris extrusa]